MTDERLRAAAEKKFDEMQNEAWLMDDAWKAGAVKFAAVFAKEREDSAMREAAGLVCDHCEDNDIPQRKTTPNGFYFYEHTNGQRCEVPRIHERLAQKGERNDDKR